jgi:hypothetical protein
MGKRNSPSVGVFALLLVALLETRAVAKSDDDSIAAQLTKLNDDDANAQITAADTLTIIPPEDEQRPAVLAGLVTHLFSDDNRLRLACVNAYSHWATTSEIPVLKKVVAMPPHPKDLDGSPNCWASAVMGLLRLDEAQAATAMQSRAGDFFFREACKQNLLKHAELNPDAAESSLKLLRMFDSDEQVTTSLDDAMQLLASDSANTRAKGASVLQIAVVDPRQRDAVLKLLASHLHSSSAGTRETYVRAYLHWAGVDQAQEIQGIVAFPEDPDRDPANQGCWADATAALVRLNLESAAIDSFNSRSDVAFFKDFLSRKIDDIARENVAGQGLAFRLHEQLKAPRARHLKPIHSGTDNSQKA